MNKLKRIVSFMLILALTLTLFPTVSFASSDMPTTGALYVGGIGTQWTSTTWGNSFYVQDLGVRTSDQLYSAVCYERGAAMSSAIEYHTYTYSGQVDIGAATPFMDFFSYQTYELGLEETSSTRWKYKSMANVAVWLYQDGKIDDTLLTEARNFNSATFDATDSTSQLVIYAKEWQAISSATGTSLTVTSAAEFLASIVKLWDAGTYPYRNYYEYYYGSGTTSYQKLLVSDVNPITETVYGYIGIKKVDDSNQALSGATFTVYSDSSCATAVYTGTSDANGEVSIRVEYTGSTTQTFWVKETGVPTNYTADTSAEPYSVTVDFDVNDSADNPAWVNGGTAIVNYKDQDTPDEPDEPTEGEGTAKIIKVDSKTGEAIGPATFKITGTQFDDPYLDPDSYSATVGIAYNATIQTDSDGVYEIQWMDSSLPNYIPAGQYTVQEITAPEGYDLTSETQSLTLWIDTQVNKIKDNYDDDGNIESTDYETIHTPKSSGDLTFENDKLHSVTLKKVDAETGAALSGASFDIYQDGKLIASTQTDSNGEITLESVESGYYIFEETAAPSGYILPYNTTHGIMLDASDTSVSEHVLTVENSAYPDINVTKIQAGTTHGLGGAVFEIWIDSVSLGSDFVTNSDGEIILSYAEYRDYLNSAQASWTVTAQEITPPEGYVLNEIAQSEELERGDASLSLVFGNEPSAGILITKQETGTTNYLAGATFQVDIDGSPFGSFTTNENGQILIEFEEYGDIFNQNHDSWEVTVTETSAPAGYLLNSTSQTIAIQEGQELAEFSFENLPYPEIHITKVDADTQKPLANTYFDVSIDNDFMGTFPTDANGEIVLDYEMYYSFLNETKDSWTVTVTEVSPTSGYLLSSNPTKTIEMNAGDAVAQFAFENYEAPNIYIYKLDAETNEPLAGAVFAVTIDGTAFGTFSTNVDGVIVIDYATYKDFLDVSKSSWTIDVEEISPPDGYFVDTDPTQQVELSSTSSPAVFTFKNLAYPSIVIEKRDEATNELLEGATFEVQIDDATVGTFTTDGTGKVTITYEEYGGFLGAENNDGWTVVVEEITPPANYFGTSGQSNQMYKGQTLSPFVFINQEYPDMVVYKTDSETQLPLAGAVFTLTSTDSSFVARTATTDEDGYITFEHIPEGVYTLKETTAPTNYFIDDTVETIIIKAGCDPVLTYYFENDRKPTLEIIKLDAITKDPLQYAKFLVERQNDDDSVTTLGTYTTDENGAITFTELEAGWYTVTETEPPTGYLVSDENVQTFYLDGNQSKTVTFENDPLNALVIEKVDSATGEALQGAKFQVSYMSGTSGTGGTVIGNYTTSYNGTITITGLEAGTYIVEETQAPSGYIMDDTAQTVYLSGDEQSVVTLEFANAPDSGLIINKLDSATKEPLADAIFQVTTDDGTVVGTGNGQYTTDETGTIHIPNLPTDTYIVTEIQAPSGYVLDGGSETVKLIAGETHSLTFYNDPKGNLVILKVDSDTNEPLEGAVFEITKSDGSYAATAEGAITSNGRYTTDVNGQITLTLLDPDTYVVTEVIAPDGYVLNSTPQTVVVNTNDTQTLTFGNPKQSSLVINKIDSITGEALSGAIFKITDSEGTYIATDSGTISSNGLYTTDNNGQIIINTLDPQTLVVTEVTAPDGYVLDSTSQTVRVNENDTQTLTFTNTPIGGLTIIKEDADDGDRLSGAEFEVREMDGGIVGTYTTDSNGKIYIPELSSGWYVATEIEAPSGYKLDTTPTNIQVVDGKTTTVTITNEAYSNITIRKIDGDTGEGLYGAAFVVYDSDGDIIGEYSSNNYGYAYVEDIPDGRYTIREITAPEGYNIDTEPKTVTVKYGKSSTLTWENYAEKAQIQVLKRSADYNSTNGLAAGTALSGAVFEIYNRVGTKVDTMVSNEYGLAASTPLPLGTYTIKEVQAPDNYATDSREYIVYLEYPNQISRMELLNYSLNVGVTIEKTGPAEVVSNQPVVYTLSKMSNDSNTSLESFYWKDTLPTQVTLNKIVTGTYNSATTYKIVYRVNGGDYRTLADNLSTQTNYTLDASSAALGLAANEKVTEVMVVFGIVPSGFSLVEKPVLYCTSNANLVGGTSFTNVAEIGGIYGEQWIQGVSRWVTTVYGIVTFPVTGY